MFFSIKKFGLKQALLVLAGTPDLSNREAEVGVSFVKASGVKVTLVTEIKEKLTYLKNFLNSIAEGIATATASLVTIAEDGRQDVDLLRSNETAALTSIEQSTENTLDRVSVKADRKIGKLQDKIRNAEGLKNFKTSSVLTKASNQRDAVETKAKTRIEQVEKDTADDLETTQNSIADLESQVQELRGNMEGIEELSKIFLGTTDPTEV